MLKLIFGLLLIAAGGCSDTVTVTITGPVEIHVDGSVELPRECPCCKSDCKLSLE